MLLEKLKRKFNASKIDPTTKTIIWWLNIHENTISNKRVEEFKKHHKNGELTKSEIETVKTLILKNIYKRNKVGYVTSSDLCLLYALNFEKEALRSFLPNIYFLGDIDDFTFRLIGLKREEIEYLHGLQKEVKTISPDVSFSKAHEILVELDEELTNFKEKNMQKGSI